METNNKYSINGDKYFAVKKTLPMGTIYEMHSHDYIEAELIISGKGEHIYNSDVSEVTRGHAYIVTKSGLHAFRAIENTELFSFGFGIEILDSETAVALSFIMNQKICCVFNDAETSHLSSRITSLINEISEQKPLSESICRALITEIIIEFFRKSTDLSNHTPSLSQKVLDIIHSEFKNELSLGLLAERLSVTPNYIGRIFTRDFGISFNSYLNKIRLRHACNMLLFSPMPVNRISLMSGYSSTEYFFAAFKKEFSVSPQKYRQIYGEKLSEPHTSVNSILK